MGHHARCGGLLFFRNPAAGALFKKSPVQVLYANEVTHNTRLHIILSVFTVFLFGAKCFGMQHGMKTQDQNILVPRITGTERKRGSDKDSNNRRSPADLLHKMKPHANHVGIISDVHVVPLLCARTGISW